MTRSLFRAALVALAAVAALAGAAAHANARRSASTYLTLPAPTGPHAVGVTAIRLVDTSRVDAFAPSRRARELSVHLWYPAVGGGTARTPYFAPQVAALNAHELGIPATVFSALSTPARTGARAEAGRHPVVLFSPGFGAESALYTLLVEDLASHGYVVVALDHTYEAPVVFPGGRLVPATGRVPDGGPSVTTRIGDVRFVLARLAGLDRRGPLARRLDLGRIGHSQGGAIAPPLMLADRRIDAGVDLDGSLMTNVDLGRPFMLVRALGHTDRLLGATNFRRAQRGPLVTATFADLQHQGFTDLMAIVPQLERHVPGIRKVLPVGKADPGRTVLAERTYVRAFLDTYLRGRPSPLLRGAPSPFASVQVAVRPAR